MNWRRFHIHRFDVPVTPDGGSLGARLLAVMATTGRTPYACRCGEMRTR